jgi:hypothetical protein
VATARRWAISILALVPLVACAGEAGSGTVRQRFVVELSEAAAAEIGALGLEVPVAGRVYVVVSPEGVEAGDDEPRTQVGIRGVPFWGTEVEGLEAGGEIVLAPGTDDVIGYPFGDLSELPPGSYRAQAFLNVHTTFDRADGHTVRMHLNSGAGQSQWRAPGNAFGPPVSITVSDGGGVEARLTVDEVIPPTHRVPEGGSLQQGNPTADPGGLLRYVKIRSDALSDFWGRDMYVGANVLLPARYAEEPDRRYPVLFLMGHFPGTRAPFGYSDDPEASVDSGRGTGFSEFWRSADGPDLVVVTIRDANPYYDTGHSVNSANVGPYGDALLDELIPHLEDEIRIVSEPWARVLAGGSTGGWEALAVQIFNPDDFGGAWGWCPDPVDFHDYQIVDVYEDENAYRRGGPWVYVEQPNNRQTDGTVITTIRQEMGYERAVGPNGRSGGQWAIWEALFSPVGEDGFAQPIWDRVTGDIDREVAEYWRENWDLTHHITTNWATLGPKLAGKLHIAVGDMDSYYLNNAVERMQVAMGELTNPTPDIEFEYGRRKPHCWIGYSRERPGEDLSNAEFVRIVIDHLQERGGRW